MVKENGLVIVGAETKIACDRVDLKLVIGKKYNDPEPVVIAAAGIAEEFDHAHMGQVMIDYIVSKGNVEQKNTVALCGKTFNTDGEAKAIAAYLRENREIKRLVVCVKWWHAPRTMALLKLRLDEAGLEKVSIELDACRSFASKRARLREYFLAIPKNILRITLENPVKGFRFVKYLLPLLYRHFTASC